MMKSEFKIIAQNPKMKKKKLIIKERKKDLRGANEAVTFASSS